MNKNESGRGLSASISGKPGKTLNREGKEGTEQVRGTLFAASKGPGGVHPSCGANSRHACAKGHTREPAHGSAADTEQQTAAHGVSVAYLLGRSITISTWQPPPKKASGRKSFTPLRAEPCSGVPSPASAVCTVENAAPVYTLLAMACGVFYQEFTKWHLPGKPPSPQPTSTIPS